MLSSNSSSCNHNPNYTPFSENDINSFTSSTSQDPNFFFGFGFGFFPHSPQFEDYDQSSWIDVYLNSPAEAPAPSPAPGNPTPAKKAPGTGAGKKDRHSKINTARGPRDRRMRLSLDIARRFFDLQDMLGFDKASRTVDWLLRSSSSAIRALARGMPGRRCSSASDDCGGEGAASSSAAAKSRRGRRGGSGAQQQQKRATVERESRRKARERARERTSQKRRLLRLRETNNAAASLYGGAGGQLVEDFSSDEATICLWDSFHLHQTQTQTAPLFPQDEQIEEFEFNGKPWEAYNSFNMSG